jgi:deoxyribodipyrimidine photolyase-related protein
VVTRLVLVLGDQLTPTVAALRAADRARDVVVMAEVMEEATYVPHHPKKIALFFAAMRKFAARLERDGWRVLYTRLDDPENAGSIPGELLRRAEETGATEVIATEPGEWRLIARLADLPLTVTCTRTTASSPPMRSSRPGPRGASSSAWSGSTARCGGRPAS